MIDDVTRLRRTLSSARPDVDDAGLVDLLRELETLKNAAAALQADLAAELHRVRVEADEARGVASARRGRGVAAEVGLARRESLHRGQQHLALGRTLPEMPHTHAAFRAGRITEWRATLLLRETACLSLADRQTVDAELAGNPDRLEQLGDGEVEAEAKQIAYRLDPASFVDRRSRAESDRRVTLRPAPDVMSQLSALLPVKDGVAVYAALQQAADSASAAGDDRTRGQVMADTLVARVTGRDDGGSVQVTVEVVVPDTVLTGQGDDACHVAGYGPVPADLARELAAGADWLRRLFAEPATGGLVTMESTQRRFPAGLRRFLRLRDRTCRIPWCDAPVRDADHVGDAARGGPTSAGNGQGLCEGHNIAKEAHGWQARPRPGPRHTVTTTTPSGHSYDSTAPPARPPRYVEAAPGRWVLAA